MSTVGDLGRRVAERSKQLGLEPEEVAVRAGMSPTYLRLVETSPSPQLSRAALWRLAAALEVSVDELSGSGMEAPPGRSSPGSRPHLEELDEQQCTALIEPGGIGRIVFVTERGPVAQPVNFAAIGRDVVFRTGTDAAMLSAMATSPVSFEVDHLDDALSEGWSVLVTGRGEVVDSELDDVRSLNIAPWAGGEHEVFVRIRPGQITGRRIRKQADLDRP
jgi:nitroimidazol reductase NimA-like FMN-containing flavoprotein (pyridoxamine 5'-phosphate oxidase superfamily)